MTLYRFDSDIVHLSQIKVGLWGKDLNPLSIAIFICSLDGIEEDQERPSVGCNGLRSFPQSQYQPSINLIKSPSVGRRPKDLRVIS
jgi:hypothetical protein